MSPFKSQAQRRKFYSLKEQGKISEKTLKEWESATPSTATLPEHVRDMKQPKIGKLKKVKVIK